MAQLRRFEPEFSKRGTRILLISFSEAHWAQVFLEETGAPFPLLLDPDRTVYRDYGLARSAWRSYSPATIFHYLKAILKGQRVRLRSWGDPYQLGGDFLVGPNRSILYVHRSRQPMDRPSVDELLTVLDRHQDAHPT